MQNVSLPNKAVAVPCLPLPPRSLTKGSSFWVTSNIVDNTSIQVRVDNYSYIPLKIKKKKKETDRHTQAGVSLESN